MGKAIDGLWEKRWSDKLGDAEPFSGVLQSLTRDLFKIQPPGEWKTVVFHF